MVCPERKLCPGQFDVVVVALGARYERMARGLLNHHPPARVGEHTGVTDLAGQRGGAIVPTSVVARAVFNSPHSTGG